MLVRMATPRFTNDAEGRQWPYDADLPDARAVEWSLRYHEPTREELTHAATIIAAYRALILATRRTREQACAALREAMFAASVRTVVDEDADAEDGDGAFGARSAATTRFGSR